MIRIVPPSNADAAVTLGDDATTLDATTQPGGVPIVFDGGPLVIGQSGRGLRMTSSGNTVIGLGVRGYSGGILVEGGSDNRIAGVAATGNINGIQLSGRDIGTGNAVSDSTISDNAASGIFFNTESTIAGFPDPATIGGVASGNTITGNGESGVRIDFADRFTITRNVISGNARLGIDLAAGGREDDFGVTRNDAQDRDQGPNQRLNFPERLTATDDGTATTVEGQVDVPDPESLTIELYANAGPNPSGHGEGEEFLATATPDAKGRLTATLPAGLAGRWLTATSTDELGNTSEFSEAVQVAVPRR